MKSMLFLSLFVLIQSAVFAQQGYQIDRGSSSKSNSEQTADKTSGAGKNVISFSPIQVILSNADQSEPDVAIQLAFERIFDNELLSAKLPVSVSLTEPYMYLAPTIKIYPKRQGAVRYAIGPQFLIGFGQGTYDEFVYDKTNKLTSHRTITIDRKQLGFMINNSLNITLAKTFYVGLDAGLGILYYDNLPNDQYYYAMYNPILNTNYNPQPAFQFNFAMGYRF